MIIDPDTRAVVLAAFNEARAAGRAPAECYRAGVLAWRERHPDQAPDYAAKQAVSIMLEAEKDNLLRVD
jgi:hypothetical protein